MKIIKPYNLKPGSFFLASRAVLNDTKLSDSAVRLYFVIQDNVNNYSTTKKAIMNKIGMKKIETFNKKIDELVASGYLDFSDDTITINEIKEKSAIQTKVIPSSWYNTVADKYRMPILQLIESVEVYFYNKEVSESLTNSIANRVFSSKLLSDLKSFIDRTTEEDRRIYVKGLAKDKNFWNNKKRMSFPVAGLFSFNKSTFEQRMNKAKSLLGIEEPKQTPADNEDFKKLHERMEEQAKKNVENATITESELKRWIKLYTDNDIETMTINEMLEIYQENLVLSEYNRLMEEAKNTE